MEERFFDQPMKNNKVKYENFGKIATGQGDDYTTACLLDYPFFKHTYKMIALDLSKQQALDAVARAVYQISFTASLDRLRNTRIYFCTGHCKSIVNKFCNNSWSNDSMQ